MIKVFSSREIAVGIYLVLLVIYVLVKTESRNAMIKVVKVACNRKLAIPFLFLVFYAFGLVWKLSQYSFWKSTYIKDITIWFLFAGVPLCFKAINHKDDHYFRKSITNNLKFTAMVEFFSGTFTFSLPIELLIQPIIAFLVIVQEISKHDKKYSSVATIVSVILSCVGVGIFYATVQEAIKEYAQLNAIDLIVRFCIPIVFSLFFIPAAYLLAIYAKYEILFYRMDFLTEDNKQTRKKYKKKAIQACGLSYNKVCLFERDYLQRMYKKMTENEYDDLVLDFKRHFNNVL